VAVEGGRWDWGNLHVEAEHPDLWGGGLLLTGSALSTQGEADVVLPRPDGADEDAVARHVDQDHARDVSFLYTKGPLRVDGLACTRRKVIPTQSYGTLLGDRRAHTTDARGFARAAVEGHLLGCRVTGSVAGDAFKYDGRYPYDDEEAPIAGDDADGAWIGAQVLARRALKGHDVTVGGGLQWHRVESSIWSAREDGSRVETIEMPTDRYHASQVFAQDIATLGERWELVAGGRYDEDSRFGGHAAARASVAWSVGPRTVVKAIVGNAFRAPSSYELHYTDDGDTQLPNPDLDPEQVETVEVSFERDIGRRGHTRLSAFHVNVDDLIDVVDLGDGVIQYQNTGEARSEGVEIEARLRAPGGLMAHAHVALQNVTQCGSGARLPNTPQASGGAGLSVPVVREHLFASVLVRGMGERPTLAGKGAPAYAVSDASLVYRSGDLPLEFSVRAQNLFDTRYVEPGFIEHPSGTLPQQRRFIAARVIYSF
jgi:outer membrane receptor protein involved in Fe transport